MKVQLRNSKTEEAIATFATLQEAIDYADKYNLVGVYIAMDESWYQTSDRKWRRGDGGLE